MWRVDVNVVNGVPKGSNAMMLVPDGVSQGSPEWSPAGDRILFARINPATGYSQTLQVTSPVGGAPQTLYDGPVGSTTGYPTWSPDGQFIAFYETDGLPGGRTIKVLEVGSGITTTVFGPQDNPIRMIEWARAQDALAFAMDVPGQPRAVYTLPLVPGGTAQFVRQGQSPSWSPDDASLVLEASGKIIKRHRFNGAEVQLNKNGTWPDWRRY